MRTSLGLLAASALTFALAGCQLVLELGDKVYVDGALDGGASSNGSTSSSGALPNAPSDGGSDSGTALPATCPTAVKGATLVPVKSPAGGITCIDATEVTVAQYKVFLDATDNGTNTSIQPPECGWNTNFVPYDGCTDVSWPGPFVCKPSEQDCSGFPRTCINWCEAYTYCKWAGKRLCGAIAGGPLDPAQALDPNVSQWSNACMSGESKHSYSYGDSFVKDACRSFDRGAADRGPAHVSGYPNCQSKEEGYKNVLGLNGNVSEWEDACVGGGSHADATCFGRGGSFADETRTRCDDQITFQRRRTEPDLGFRCCGP